jgi:hypothetical protein
MKKLLLSIGVIASAFAATSQADTLTAHFMGNPALYYADAAPFDSGYVSGNNAFGDLAKMQLFDNTNGVTGAGTINKMALAIPVKMGTGSVLVAIWGDNAGAPANLASPLGSVVVPLTSIDTSFAAFNIVDGSRFYNHIVTFTSPVTIPASGKFWAGVVLPTGPGNGIALYTNNNTSNPLPAGAAGKSGEIWDDATFHTIASAWGVPLSFSVYPIVNFTSGINENVASTSVYPNPANTELNIKTTEEITSVVVTTTDGKTVVTGTSSNINVSELNAGMYIYQVTTVSGKIGTGNFVKN